MITFLAEQLATDVPCVEIRTQLKREAQLTNKQETSSEHGHTWEQHFPVRAYTQITHCSVSRAHRCSNSSRSARSAASAAASSSSCTCASFTSAAMDAMKSVNCSSLLRGLAGFSPRALASASAFAKKPARKSQASTPLLLYDLHCVEGRMLSSCRLQRDYEGPTVTTLCIP